ncbi:MAG: hypothetical protein K2X34_00445 [Hyphomonadaceae bacterium]|nr:hypothetical protein [Hyphomonadaceae bacterium]
MATVSAAAAQKGDAWRPRPIEGGCIVMIVGTTGADWSIRWDQACEPGEPIEGAGTLHIRASDGYTVSLVGTFSEGVPHGPATIRGFNPTGALMSEEAYIYDMGCSVTDRSCRPYQPG